MIEITAEGPLLENRSPSAGVVIDFRRVLGTPKLAAVPCAPVRLTARPCSRA
jgi:hypothetical protein